MYGQFTIIQNKLFADKRLKSIDFAVIAVLQSMMGINGYCYPSYSHIADYVHCSRRTVITSMNRLVKMGYVVKKKRTIGNTEEQTSNLYYINNNPDIDFCEKDAPPPTSGVELKIHHSPMKKFHSETNEFFLKNAPVRACACENDLNTPNCITTESDIKSDERSDVHQINCPCSEDDIRLWNKIAVDWENTFKNPLLLYVDIFKRPEHCGYYYRKGLLGLKKGFDEQFFLNLFKKHSDESLICIENAHFADEMEIPLYDR